jgi:tRNA-dihydrouridine synthase A
MMTCTDRHFRYLLRLISRNVMLYTEMISSGALIHGDAAKHLAFDASEHPLAIQLGGNVPEQLRSCAALAGNAGYDEINLNVGCPSDRVQDAGFGACLMAHPDRVADCVAAMQDGSRLPVTVKLRTGIDDLDSYDYLAGFVERVATAGCRTFIIHARKAWLRGLSPSQNRNIPPLQYQRVYRIKREFPRLEVIINGGFNTMDGILQQYPQVDGVMIGRMVRQDPFQLAQLDATLFGNRPAHPTRQAVIGQFMHYMEREISRGTRFSRMARHLPGMFRGMAGGRAYRRFLSEHLHRPDTGVELISKALQFVPLA